MPGGGPGPINSPLRLLAAARSPAFPDLSPPQGAASAEENWRVPTHPKAEGHLRSCQRRGPAWAGNRTLRGGAAGTLGARGSRAGGLKRGQVVRSPGLRPVFASHWRGGPGPMTPPLHTTARACNLLSRMYTGTAIAQLQGCSKWVPDKQHQSHLIIC